MSVAAAGPPARPALGSSTVAHPDDAGNARPNTQLLRASQRHVLADARHGFPDQDPEQCADRVGAALNGG